MTEINKKAFNAMLKAMEPRAFLTISQTKGSVVPYSQERYKNAQVKIKNTKKSVIIGLEAYFNALSDSKGGQS